MIPESTPTPIAKVIQDCWQSNFAIRPNACNVAKDLEMYSSCDYEFTSQNNSISFPESSSTYVEEDFFLGSHQVDGDPMVSGSANNSTNSQASVIADNANQSSTIDINSQQIQSAPNFIMHDDASSQARSSQEAMDIEHIKSRL